MDEQEKDEFGCENHGALCKYSPLLIQMLKMCFRRFSYCFLLMSWVMNRSPSPIDFWSADVRPFLFSCSAIVPAEGASQRCQRDWLSRVNIVAINWHNRFIVHGELTSLMTSSSMSSIFRCCCGRIDVDVRYSCNPPSVALMFVVSILCL